MFGDFFSRCFVGLVLRVYPAPFAFRSFCVPSASCAGIA